MSSSALAQVRLSRGEWNALRETQRILRFRSTSEALREAIRLLHREATETAMAEGISHYYSGEPAPVPHGVPQVDLADIEAADRSEW